MVFDFHGEPGGFHSAGYKSYHRNISDSDQGKLTAPFEGTHGWYLRNDTSSPVTVNLQIEGKYSNVGIKPATFRRK